MTLEALAFVSQIVSAVAVVASLVFVGVQLRQNTQQRARANLANIVASEAAGAALAQNALLAVATDQSLADIVSKGRKDFSTLNESERVRFSAHMMALLNHTQVGYLGFKRGTAPGGVLAGLRWRTCAFAAHAGRAGMVAPRAHELRARSAGLF